MLALLGSMFPGNQNTAQAPATNVDQPSTSPLDDLEKVAGITSGEGEELDKYEDPMKTLKSRFPTLDPILRGSLEELGTALQKHTEEVEKRKASYAIFLVPPGASAYVAKSIEVKHDLKIPHMYRESEREQISPITFPITFSFYPSTQPWIPSTPVSTHLIPHPNLFRTPHQPR
jgi:hypothetical protein